MASTYSTNLKIELIGTGEQAGSWGDTTNTNFGTAVEQAIVGKADITMSSTTVTLTLTNTNAAQNARAIYLNLTGTPGGAATLEVPAVQKPYIVRNGSSSTVTVKVSGQTGVAVPVGKTMWLYNNGSDVVNAIDNLPSGATVGGVAIGTGSGSVTSVAVSGGTTGLTVSGSPITTSGTITLAGTLNVANGGLGVTTLTANNVLLGNGTSPVAFVAPGSSGNVLTSNGTTWASAAPAAQVYPGAGVAVSTGSAWTTSKTSPTGDIVGTSDTQTLTNKTLSSPELTGAPYVNGSYRGNVVAVSALNIDCSAGNYFTKTISANSTFTVSNVPASRSYAFTLELTHTSGTVTWFSGVQWPGGNAPTLTNGKTSLFVFVTDDGGTRWRGAALVDYTT
jgi:hypothetical protein